MPLKHEPRVRELISLIAYEADAKVRKLLTVELEGLLKQERTTLKARLLEIPHRGGYFFREE